MRYFGLAVAVIMILVSGCNRRPKSVLSDDEMVDLMVDMAVAEVYMQNRAGGYISEVDKDAITEKILKQHGLTKADLDSTLNWYGRNMDKYCNLYAKVDAELAKRAKSVGSEQRKVESENDLWPYSRHLMLSSLSGSDNFNFSLDGSKLNRGDLLEWKMRGRHSLDGTVMLGVNYADGGSGYVYHQLGGSNVVVSFQTDTARQVRRVFGVLRLRDRMLMPAYLDSVQLQVLPLDTLNYYQIHSQTQIGRAQRHKKIEVKDTVESVGSTPKEQRNILKDIR